MSRKDRVINAALHLFGRRDFAEVKTREIAELAEVSLRLMWHHFKTKEELRAAVDDLVLSAIKEVGATEASDTDLAQRPELESIMQDMSDLNSKYGSDFILYWRRMLVDEGDRGARAFTVLRARCDEFARFNDPANLTAVDRHRELAIMSLFAGAVFLKPHVERIHNVDIHSAQEYEHRMKATKGAIELILSESEGM